MASGFLSKPSLRQVQTTAFWTSFGLIMGLGSFEVCVVSHGPLKRLFFDVYSMSSGLQSDVFRIFRWTAVLEFATVWIVSLHLHVRHTWLWLMVFLLEWYLWTMPR